MIGSPKRSALISGLLHAAAIVVVVVTTGVTNPPAAVMRVTTLTGRDLSRYLPAAPPRSHGGGGGGAGDLTPATKGQLPRFAARQFTPPAVVVRNLTPELAMEPTLIGSPQIVVPDLKLPYGDPNGVAGPPSGGRGTRGGIGDGDDGGVGNRRGPGYGDGGDDGGVTGSGGIRATVTAPVLVTKIEPEYSDEARRARLQGYVVLYIEVDTSGRAGNIQVRQSLGLGLDDKAVEAVRKWKFRPGYRNGRPVVTSALVEVYFRLL